MNQIKRLHDKMITLNDKIEIEPFDGRRRWRVLNRTKITFSLDNQSESCFGAYDIHLRATKGKSRFELELIKLIEGEYFQFKSLSGDPFLLNGNLCFRCLVRSGDILDFDNNRLRFRKLEQEKKESLPLSSWPQEASLYLEGETGTGKSYLARKIHDEFVGPQAPFIAVNLAAFSESLIESELFGHEKGSFTGALRERRGAVELAKGGTLFIDEIDSLPIHLQVKLLHFLDDKTYRRVGGERLLKTNCRLVFASGQSLKSLTSKKAFRSDLYFRILSGLHLKLRPLRENPERILQIIESHSLASGVTFSSETISYYEGCPWPGNIRQLYSHLNRKIYQNKGQSLIHLGDCDHELMLWGEGLLSLKEGEIRPLQEIKYDYCKKVLLDSRGSYELASQRLKIAVSTLRRTLAA